MNTVSLDTRVPGVALLSLAGEHELYGARKLQERIESLIAEGLSIVVDLTETVFLDSSIVGVLLQHKNWPRRAASTTRSSSGRRRASRCAGCSRSPDFRRSSRSSSATKLSRARRSRASRPGKSRRRGRGFRAAATCFERRARAGRHLKIGQSAYRHANREGP